jgi:hypothetical protein
MASPFPSPEKGRAANFLDTAFAKQVIDVLNALVNLKCSPQGTGKFTLAKDSAILDLSAIANQLVTMNNLIGQLQQQVTALQSQPNLSGAITNLQNQVNDLQDQIDGFDITATCNADGTITLDWFFGGDI